MSTLALGIISGLLLYFNLIEHRLPQWLESNYAAWVEAGALIWAFAYFLFWRPYLGDVDRQKEIQVHEDRLEAKLSFEFQNGPIDCYSDDDGPKGDGQNPVATYLRLIIKNDSTADVVGVHAVLTNVEKHGKHYPQNRRPLLFSPYRGDNIQERTIKPGAKELIDLLRIEIANSTVRVPTKGWIWVLLTDNAGKDIYGSVGMTTITLEIMANQMQMITLELNFNWQGTRWNPAPQFSIKSIK